MGGWDIVLRGGRVIDPESGFDALADVAIDWAGSRRSVPAWLRRRPRWT